MSKHGPQHGDNVKLAEDGETYIAEIYLDPTDLNKKCTENDVNNNTVKNSGCMRWFAYKEDGDETPGTFTMILDHNSSETLPAWNSSHSNESGPKEVLERLQTDTDGWSSELVKPETYKPSDNRFTWTIDYSNYGNKARLISAEEIADLTKNDRLILFSDSEEDSWIIGSGNMLLLDKGMSKCFNIETGESTCIEDGVTSKYWWLFENLGILEEEGESCKDYGCKNGQASDTAGYWTASPNASFSYLAWYVGYEGYLSSFGVHYTSFLGVRPVITISKSNLL